MDDDIAISSSLLKSMTIGTRLPMIHYAKQLVGKGVKVAQEIGGICWRRRQLADHVSIIDFAMFRMTTYIYPRSPKIIKRIGFHQRLLF